jgi:hypothetical protein
MDASDVIRKNMQIAKFVGYKVKTAAEQPTVTLNTPCSLEGSTVVRKFSSYEDYENVKKGLTLFLSNCPT